MSKEIQLAANAPEFIAELQKLKVKNELNASDVKKCFGDAWYDNLPSVKSNGGVDSQMTKIQTEELKDCVKQHRSYIMKKAGLSKRLLDLTEEEPNLKDQLLLYQLKCRDAQASISSIYLTIASILKRHQTHSPQHGPTHEDLSTLS